MVTRLLASVVNGRNGKFFYGMMIR